MMFSRLCPKLLTASRDEHMQNIHYILDVQPPKV
jgi:hypothetical protein